MITLLLGEVFVRLCLGGLVDHARLSAELERVSIKPLVRPSADPKLFYELTPHLRHSFLNSLVVTDAEGCRISSRNQPEASEAGTRIALLGDSTSFGYGVDYDDTYGEKLRHRLQDQLGVPIELKNYSVPGYNAQQEVQVFIKKVIHFKPHLLILHHDHNDSQPTAPGFSPEYLLPDYGDNPLHSALIKLVLRQVRILRTRIRLFLPRADPEESEYLDGYLTSGPLYERHIESRELLARRTRALGIPTLVVLFNAYVEADDDYKQSKTYLVLHKRLSDQLRGMGFYVLDLYPRYQAELNSRAWGDLSEWWISKDPVDGHPNPQGHEFIADVLIRYMLGQGEIMSAIERHR